MHRRAHRGAQADYKSLVVDGTDAVMDAPNIHRKPYRLLATVLGFTFFDLMEGVRVHETTKKEHGKMLIVDGKLAAFGSYNASVLADDRYAEAMLFTRDAEIIAEVGAALKDTIGNHSEYHPWFADFARLDREMAAIAFSKKDPSF